MADYAALLRDHVTLKCRSLDRIFLQAYVPKLQSVVKFPIVKAFGATGHGRVARARVVRQSRPRCGN